MSADGPVGAERLAALLAGAGLDPAGLVSHPPLPDGEQAWALGSTSDTWFDDWKVLRALVPETGRWPLAMTSWGVDIDPLNRRDPAGLIGRLDAVDVDAALDRLEAESLPMPLDDWFDYHEDATRQRCGDAPTLEGVRAALGDEPLELAIERWMLRWELTHGGLSSSNGTDAPYLDWFVPRGQPVHLLLLPRPEPWSAGVYTGGYQWEDPIRELRPALFRKWAERYGAEPAANWDTMLQLVVTWPPSTIDDAFELARSMTLLWPNTNGGPGITVREMAFDLVGRDRWFLHCRP